MSRNWNVSKLAGDNFVNKLNRPPAGCFETKHKHAIGWNVEVHIDRYSHGSVLLHSRVPAWRRRSFDGKTKTAAKTYRYCRTQKEHQNAKKKVKQTSLDWSTIQLAVATSSSRLVALTDSPPSPRLSAAARLCVRPIWKWMKWKNSYECMQRANSTAIYDWTTANWVSFHNVFSISSIDIFAPWIITFSHHWHTASWGNS